MTTRIKILYPCCQLQTMEDKFLNVAKQAAQEAGKVIMRFYGKDHSLMFKGDRSDFATPTDLEAEKIIVKILSKNFPTHNIISEENVRIDNKSNYTWAIDPIDGTISFASHMPFFAVSIGLLEKNQPIVGVIYHVVQKDLYWGVKGKGAYLNGKRISVSKQKELNDSVIGLGVGRITRRHERLSDYFLPLLDKVRYVYMLGGGVVSMAFVARGWLDAFFSKAWIWDQAAGGVIIEESGGRITDRFGNPPDWSAERIELVCSNGLIHQAILEALK